MRVSWAILASLGLATILAGCTASSATSGYADACYGRPYTGYRASYYGYAAGYRPPYFGYGGAGAHHNGC